MIAATLLATWAGSYAIVAGVAGIRAFRNARRHAKALPAGATPRVVLLRPCAGSEASLAANLRSTAALRYPGRLDIVFTVASADDPAWPIVSAIADEIPHARAMVATPQHPNHKVGQLATALDELGPGDDDIVVVVDSDVDLSRYDLSALVRPVASDPTVGASWSPPVEHAAAQGLGDRVSQAVLGASLQSFALLGPLDPSGLVGKTFAISAGALRAIGGMHALGRYLAEDMELARRLATHHLRIAMVPAPTLSNASGRSLADSRDRYARWLVALKAQRGPLLLSYPLLLAAAPLLLVAALGLAWSAPSFGLSVALGIVLVRLGVALLAQRLTGVRVPLRVVPMADLVLLAAAARAARGRGVTWRGRELRLDGQGRLQPAA